MSEESVKFEHLVNDILIDEIGSYFVTKNVYHNRKYLGKSGHNHQIDVSAEIKIGCIDLLFLVECKYYSKRVGIKEVLEFSSRINDVSANKGILVSAKGFQKGAITYAKTHRIALVKVSDSAFIPCTGGGQYNPLFKLINEFKSYYNWYNDTTDLSNIDLNLIPFLALLEKEIHYKADFFSIKNRSGITDSILTLQSSSDYKVEDILVFHGFCYSFIGENIDFTVNNSGIINYSIIEYLISNKIELPAANSKYK